jgi:hypothetical protein
MIPSGTAIQVRRRPEAVAILAIGLLCVSALVLAHYLLGL